MKRLDVSGQRFSSLTAIQSAGMKGKQSLWLCYCDCGKECVVQLGNLRSGHTKSCGCLRSTATTNHKTTHGMYGTSTYNSWSSIITRCTNIKNHKYPDYGGRGIQVCDRWLIFENFLSDMGDRPLGTTIGRIDNNGNYIKENCEWQGNKTQARNKRNTRLFTFNNLTATLTEHCEILELNPSTVRSRLYTYKWPLERALTK